MAAAASTAGWHVAVLNMRGCGGSQITSPRFFSAHRGSTDDVRVAVAHCRVSAHLARDAPCVAAVGWSNGATIINNALAEQSTTHPGSTHWLDAGATLACPLNMIAANKNLQRPFHRLAYDRSIANGLVRNFVQSGARDVFAKAQRDGSTFEGWDGTQMTVDIEKLLLCR